MKKKNQKVNCYTDIARNRLSKAFVATPSLASELPQCTLFHKLGNVLNGTLCLYGPQMQVPCGCFEITQIVLGSSLE